MCWLQPYLYPGWRVRFMWMAVSLRGFWPAEHGAEIKVQPDQPIPASAPLLALPGAPMIPGGALSCARCGLVLNLRERLAVDDWLASGRWFHIMRDWWSHTDLVLAGMWGGVAGVLPLLAPLMASYQPSTMETPNIDQWFLRDCLWRYLRQSAGTRSLFHSAGAVPGRRLRRRAMSMSGRISSGPGGSAGHSACPWIARLPCLPDNDGTEETDLGGGGRRRERTGRYLHRQNAPADRHQDRWEFPAARWSRGGSAHRAGQGIVGRDRDPGAGLCPFMELHHDYPDKQGLAGYLEGDPLHGEPVGKEGQECRWVPLASLHEYRFPDANGPIVARLQASLCLKDRYQRKRARGPFDREVFIARDRPVPGRAADPG